ncbi:MAG: DUF2358 domain-containing protein [Microcystaceae cyanobacterium]
MDILEQIKTDYERFPADPSYHLYTENVYFKDPLTQFKGLKRYQQMVEFMGRWFQEIRLDLHHLSQEEQTIFSTWTLYWTSPLPWQPRIVISGRSELLLNENNLIYSHQDYWDCSPWDVIKQHFFPIDNPKQENNLHNGEM